MSKSKIGQNPLDSLISSPVKNTSKKKEKKEPTKQNVEQPKLSLKKQRMTVQISHEVVEKAKDAVYWTPGLTIAKLTENAIKEAVAKIEKRNGKSFSEREEELASGRPLK